ncbi:MAG: hypothetical protein J6D52_13470 [Clostridia bacterium]|nr:hypothetical protein [Clostridia bacterium]
MKLISKIISILLIAVFLFSATACSDTMDAYIYFELPYLPETLDPQTASTDAELLIIRNIHEGLLRKNSKGEIVGGIAEDFQKNGLTYTFTLRSNAKWSNGDKITADDFVFALRRAVSPETKAPFVSRLYSITGALDINNGKANVESLGVKALDKKTLSITLNKEDPLFLETLTTSIAMPCNEKFFYETAGKYGLFADSILSSGSYRLTRWRKETFGIRLYKNEGYKGFAKAQNSAVFITCNNDETPLQKLQRNSIDMAFIDSASTLEAENSSLKTESFQNICWILTLGKDFTPNMRKALAMMVGGNVYSNSLPTSYSVATSLFPEAISQNTSPTGITAYNLPEAKKLYLKELEKLEDKKFPSDVILYYYDDGNIKNVVTDIVGHWQSNISAFINIESVSSSTLLTSQLTDPSYKMSIFPIRADSTNLAEYLKIFGITYNGEPLAEIQTNLLKSNNIIPIMFQNTVLAYSPALSSVYTELGNGYVDFAFIVKEE